MVHPPKNTGVISHPYVSVMATFLCSQIDRYGEVQLHDLFIMQCQVFPSPNYAPPDRYAQHGVTCQLLDHIAWCKHCRERESCRITNSNYPLLSPNVNMCAKSKWHNNSKHSQMKSNYMFIECQDIICILKIFRQRENGFLFRGNRICLEVMFFLVLGGLYESFLHNLSFNSKSSYFDFMLIHIYTSCPRVDNTTG